MPAKSSPEFDIPNQLLRSSNNIEKYKNGTMAINVTALDSVSLEPEINQSQYNILHKLQLNKIL